MHHGPKWHSGAHGVSFLHCRLSWNLLPRFTALAVVKSCHGHWLHALAVLPPFLSEFLTQNSSLPTPKPLPRPKKKASAEYFYGPVLLPLPLQPFQLLSKPLSPFNLRLHSPSSLLLLYADTPAPASQDGRRRSSKSPAAPPPVPLSMRRLARVLRLRGENSTPHHTTVPTATASEPSPTRRDRPPSPRPPACV